MMNYYEIRWETITKEKIISFVWAETSDNALEQAKKFKDYHGIISVFKMDNPAFSSWLGEDSDDDWNDVGGLVYKQNSTVFDETYLISEFH